MSIQDQVAAIHHKYGTSEKANYEIQLLFEAELKKHLPPNALCSFRDLEEFAKWAVMKHRTFVAENADVPKESMVNIFHHFGVSSEPYF